jgi:hypothetical protein
MTFFSRHILVICTIVVSLLLSNCSTHDKNQISGLTDTLDYREKDYELMRQYFNSDSLFSLSLNEQVESGDTNSLKLKTLLTVPYDSRKVSRMTDSEIDVLILSYYTAKKTLDRFNEIESTLPKTDPHKIRQETDSMINLLDSLKKELKMN